jgi:type III secretion protein C
VSLLARLRAFAVAAVLAWVPAAFGGGTPWPDAPYSYYANNAKLEAVLADFATGFGLSLSIRPDVSGVVNGRFATRNATEFISKLAGVYGFVWYAHAGTLFISRASDAVTRGVPAPGGNVANMRKALADLGVLEPRFGWGELNEQGVAMVSGPPSYVALIENTIRNLPARAQQLKMFRLQHASADDRMVQYRDQQLKVPGLASILRTMVAASGAAPASAAAAAAAVGPQPTVQAEPRLNAIIVQDLPERLPLYQQLIEQLDVPTPQIEIEAMIIDVSSQRARELGVNWSGRIGKTAFGFGFGSESTTPPTLSFTSGSTAAGNYLITQLRLLESQGEAEIQSRPSVLTSENMTALLDLAETFYIRVQGERVATVTPVTAGTTLRVTPHVLQQDGRTLVQLKIDIEDGAITDRKVDTLPTVSRSTVSTEATVQHGEALLIAGYASNRKIGSKEQVPLLGDVPILGALFSSRSGTEQKRERVFLIRPRVVGLPAEPAPAAELAPAARAALEVDPAVVDSRGELRYATQQAEVPATVPAAPVPASATTPAPAPAPVSASASASAPASAPAAPPRPQPQPQPAVEEVREPFRRPQALPVKPYQPARVPNQ